MKLEVGQFVRFKDKRGNEYIRKIVEIPEDNRYASLYLDKDANYSKGLSIKNVIKASYNIIDILEVGDYVNGYKVEEVNNNLNEHKGICNSLDTYLWVVNVLDEFEEIVIFEKDIKTILTKEQFEKMSYKVLKETE